LQPQELQSHGEESQAPQLQELQLSDVQPDELCSQELQLPVLLQDSVSLQECGSVEFSPLEPLSMERSAFPFIDRAAPGSISSGGTGGGSLPGFVIS
jgi:hypothetical protein